MNEELIDKLSFEDRVEYNLQAFRNASVYNFDGLSCYIFLCPVLIISLISKTYFPILFGFIILLIAKFFDLKKYNKSMKILFDKYFQVKPKDKKKK